MGIVSGGQTGVDRAALEFAIANDFAHGGWCPRGRRAEDGTIDERYQLREAKSQKYAERTELNVIDSDGTVIFARDAALRGGTRLTQDLAESHGRPCLVLIESPDADSAANTLRLFIAEHGIETLNVAGPRESQAPQLGVFVKAVLTAALVAPRED